MKILKNFLKNNDSKPTPLQKTVETVQSVIEETDSEKEIARKKAIDVALKEFRKIKICLPENLCKCYKKKHP